MAFKDSNEMPIVHILPLSEPRMNIENEALVSSWWWGKERDRGNRCWD
jgi:hypothetical protein